MDAELRILYIGEFATPQYDDAMADAFERLGNQVWRLRIHERYLSGRDPLIRLQRRFLLGPAYVLLWLESLRLAQTVVPDVIYFRKPIEFPPSVLRLLKNRTGAILAEYMNDDPFGPDRRRHWLRYYHCSIPLFDVHFAFRKLNVSEFYTAGAIRVEVLWPYYVADMHYPSDLTAEDQQEYTCDAVFIGHGEPDIRVDCFDALVEAGLDFRLGGSGFEPYAVGRPHARLLPTRYVSGDAYARSVQAANCALCFPSRRNRDVLTFRAFEVPACGGVLVAERNSVMERLFRDGGEAFLFSSPQELVTIVRRLKAEPQLRKQVAAQGRKRVVSGGHEVIDRARTVLSIIKGIV